MRITKLRIQKYRSIEDLDLAFPSFYTALCGKNDSGKTNIIRSIKTVFSMDTGPFVMDDGLSIKRDLPSWLQKDGGQHEISLSATCLVDPIGDEGLHLFLKDYLKLGDIGEITIVLKSSCSTKEPENKISVDVDNVTLTSIQAQEVANKLTSTGVILFHNSTEALPPYFRHRGLDYLGDIVGQDRSEFEAAKKRLNTVISKMAREQQRGLSEILGRLKEQYKVGVSAPEFNPAAAPLGITLGEDEVELENWGSGTQNRTKILHTLFRAKRLSQSETSASKVTPVVVVEEPESFLHPSAQAEFGRMLQDLASEFRVQVL